MTVYVDTMRAPFRGMKMCHMIADSTSELLAMADRIGVARKWIQHPGTHREHFDIAMSKRALAVKAGAVEISRKDVGRRLFARRVPEITQPVICVSCSSVNCGNIELERD